MTPRWFYIALAGAAIIAALGSALKNFGLIGDSRYSYHPATGSHPAVIFDSRKGEACEWDSRPRLICYHAGSAIIDFRNAIYFEHKPTSKWQSTVDSVDTGTTMTDSTH